MKKRYITLLLSLLCFTAMQAALSTGYYKIYNAGYGRYMYEDFTSNTICTTTSCADTDYEKIWKLTVSGNTVTLQNAFTGNYAQTQSTTSAQFTTGSTAVSFSLTTNSDGTYMFSSGSYMHCAASQSYYIVNWWDSSSTYSKWTVQSVTVDETALAAAQAEYEAAQAINTNASTYNTALLKIFTDASCTQLKSSYASDAALITAMKNAGITNTGLQEVACSVKNQWSGETNSDMAGTFRVRSYKPYTRAYYWRNQLNATQLTDMNNPTGIYANAKDVVYIFVGGTIPSGCSLRVVGLTSNDQANYTSGTELKEGVNAIMTSADYSHLWIMYTYTGDTQVDMSSLDNLTIHIEGGTVYGFADVTGEDEDAANATYKTALTAANTAATAKSADTSSLCFVVKGNRGLFYFPLTTYNQIWQTSAYGSYSYTTNYSIYKSIHWFDNVLAWEWGLMGFTKRVYDGQTDAHEHVTGGQSLYPTYCNNLALTLQGSGNPFSTTGYTSMPGVSGVESSYNAERAAFDNWCVGHESGHNNQGAINLPSSTESSNNLFSNVVCYLHGYRMSRGEPVSTTNSDYQSGTQFALRDIGSTHRMYWQLYLYYHEAQRKTDFYPTLFESLRSDPMNLNSGECFLKFYQKACDAAQEDLTEFFRGWGFFVPFTSQVFGDYTTRTLTLTQTQIDAAIAAVKAKYSTENRAIMFIEDRIEKSYRWDAWASGSSDVRPVQDYAVGTCGTLGSVNDYSGTATAASYTSYTLSGNTLSLSGTGGEGFLVYDASGTLVAFSNNSSFTIPESAVASGFTVYAVNADNTLVEVKNVTDAGTDADKLAALKSAIAAAQTIDTYRDATNTKVGYYKASALTTLESAISTANTVVSNATASRYSEMINLLNTEMATLATSTTARINLVSGNTYVLRNNLYTTRYMANNSDKLWGSTNTALDDYQQWIFTSAGNGQWYIQSKSSSHYISTLGTSTQATSVATSTSDAFKFDVEEYSTGVFALNSNASDGYKYLHIASSQSYYVVGWTYDSQASHWQIILVDDSSAGATNLALSDLLAQTYTLLTTCTTQFSASGYTAASGYEYVSSDAVTATISEYLRGQSIYDSGTTDEKAAEVTTLQQVYNTLWWQVYGPRQGHTYRIISAKTAWNRTKAMTSLTTVNGGSTEASPGWEEVESNNPEQWWQFIPTSTDSVFTIYNLKSKNFIASYGAMGDTGAQITLHYMGSDQYTLTVAGSTLPLHCRHQVDGYVSSSLTEWAAELGNASCWYLEDVELGDVNLDGRISLADVTALIAIIQGTYTADHGVTDIDADGDVDTDDVTALVSLLLAQ